MLPPPEIIYEFGPVLVVNKPAGVLTQAPPGIDSLEVRVRQFLEQREGSGGDVYVGLPHRLDRPVSGAIIVALTKRATRRLGEQFEARTVEKTYWACVEGHVAPPAETWRDQVRKVPGVARSEVVDAEHPEGRPAVLHFHVLGSTEHGSWLQIALETGRTHQVRVQAASRGHPVLGDAQYGSSIPFGVQHEDVRERSIALHARRVVFRHPRSRETVDVTAPLPAAWDGLARPTEAG